MAGISCLGPLVCFNFFYFRAYCIFNFLRVQELYTSLLWNLEPGVYVPRAFLFLYFIYFELFAWTTIYVPHFCKINLVPGAHVLAYVYFNTCRLLHFHKAPEYLTIVNHLHSKYTLYNNWDMSMTTPLIISIQIHNTLWQKQTQGHIKRNVKNKVHRQVWHKHGILTYRKKL